MKFAFIVFGLFGLSLGLAAAAPSRPLSELQRDMVNLRFGMFIHFSPTTYLDPTNHLHPDHAPPRQGRDGIAGTKDDLSPALFNPTRLDCGQWADAAKSAGMKFAVLTAKHHDGFCLWPSRYSTYTVAQGCGRDVVREFVDAFRARGVKVGLYYSIRDRTERIAGEEKEGGVSPEKIRLIKNQLTELLTNYGDLLYIVFDGWGNSWHESPSFADIPYAVIHDHIKSLQPNCLIAQHNESRFVADIPHLEQRAGVTLSSEDGWPAIAGDTLQGQWFWRPDCSALPLKDTAWVVEQNLRRLHARNIVFQLNCAPNRDGLMDGNVVTRLAEIGRAWQPPPPLERIPASWQNWPVPASVPKLTGRNVAVSATTRQGPGKTLHPAARAVDGDPKTFNEVAGPKPWIELDLGRVASVVGVRLWNRHNGMEGRLAKGRILLSAQPIDDGVTATVIPIGEPPGFPAVYPMSARARHVRIESLGTGNLNLGEIEVWEAVESPASP